VCGVYVDDDSTQPALHVNTLFELLRIFERDPLDQRAAVALSAARDTLQRNPVITGLPEISRKAVIAAVADLHALVLSATAGAPLQDALDALALSLGQHSVRTYSLSSPAAAVSRLRSVRVPRYVAALTLIILVVTASYLTDALMQGRLDAATAEIASLRSELDESAERIRLLEDEREKMTETGESLGSEYAEVARNAQALADLTLQCLSADALAQPSSDVCASAAIQAQTVEKTLRVSP
jgi:hypothetical protein